MARRAFGKLPSVQPLIRSIYAAPSAEVGEPLAPGASRGVANLADERTQSDPPRQRVALPETGEPAVGSSVRPAEPAPPVPKRPLAKEPHNEAHAPPPETASRPPELLDQVAWMLPELPPLEANDPPVVKDPRLPQAADVALEPMRVRPSSAPSPQGRRMRPVRSEALLPVEQKPEIHISIGNIELHAAPPEARPERPAAFVPRVSLQEFLSRKPEGRR
jgi:hypothetical protein